jgi:pilus assembly protein FimV
MDLNGIIDTCQDCELKMSDLKRPVNHKAASAESHSPPSAMSESGQEAVTSTEIHTKLDLARQFIDMGDPDSARHMLDEVLDEGDPLQRQEAVRLIETLP